MLRLRREHGKSPGWWDTVDRRDQIQMLGDLRLRIEEEAAERLQMLRMMARR